MDKLQYSQIKGYYMVLGMNEWKWVNLTQLKIILNDKAMLYNATYESESLLNVQCMLGTIRILYACSHISFSKPLRGNRIWSVFANEGSLVQRS